ncbi:MAG: hypothetical protein B6D55_06065 [Candidatus Omnitrophica bacterium 4484_70.2]|nr:MAG: hypothetical protein B6D55_06065 [Candidatus Omnitrophica bacterium 4484_70.2]
MKIEDFFGEKLTGKEKVIFYSLLSSLAIIVLGLIIYLVVDSLNILLNFILIAVFVSFVPFFIYRYLHYLELRDCEKNLPNFLNDLKEAKESGVSFPDAIKACRGNYGKLNKYVDKLKRDISWGVSIDYSIKHLRKSLSQSRLLSRSFTILHETYRSGGNIEDILDTLIESLLRIMESENYKRSLMQQHVFMMYGIFFLYIGLIIALGNFLFLLPMMTGTGISETESTGFNVMKSTSPCSPKVCTDNFCRALCGYYNIVGGMFGFGEPYSMDLYYKSLFFTMILIQGFFTGIIAGQISTRSWLDSLKHGLIMFVLGFAVIILTNLLGLF